MLILSVNINHFERSQRLTTRVIASCRRVVYKDAEATVPEVAAHDIAIQGSHGFIGRESQHYFLFNLPQFNGTSLQGAAR